MFFRIGCLLSAACCELRCKVGGMPAADLKAIAEFSTCLVACFICAVLAFADAPSFLTFFRPYLRLRSSFLALPRPLHEVDLSFLCAV